LIPFLALPVIFYLNRLRDFPAGWVLLVGTAAWSLFAIWTDFLGGELFPTSWLRDPIFEYSLPKLQSNVVAPNAGYFLGLRGWQSLLPLVAALLVVGLWPTRTEPTVAVLHPLRPPRDGGAGSRDLIARA
jgi:hypothetical protein